MHPRSDSVVFVVSVNAEDAERVARPLRDRGWDVETAVKDPALACARIGQCRPHAVVISLDDDPDTGCDLACALTVAEAIGDVPILVVGGTTSDLALLGERAPDALFLETEEVPWALKRLLYRQ